MHESLLQQMSKAYPDFAPGVPQGGGFDYSSQAGNGRAIRVSDAWTAKCFPNSLGFGEQAYSQRLSVGMTPKTLRLPKPGEMLLSVRGSPLGVYKEDGMEAINDSDFTVTGVTVPTDQITTGAVPVVGVLSLNRRGLYYQSRLSDPLL
ncbi:hypothetical protein IFM89_026843 [Coptis chinensis]|uniref:Uncharacterized protein n=1 Tax=Coptis chinensis TaxID=261450 RepID=A0A835M0U7_9MAGN|nr:hypothetical protein IFM89_026843 [Coptis chinensis]